MPIRIKAILRKSSLLLALTMLATGIVSAQVYTQESASVGNGTLNWTQTYISQTVVLPPPLMGYTIQSWIASGFSFTDAAGTFSPSVVGNATYECNNGNCSYSSATLTLPTSAGGDIITFAQWRGTWTITDTGSLGFISPKYKVMGIAYAVPGESSYVQYTDTNMLGTSTSTSSSYSYNVTTAESVCGSTGSDTVCGNGNGVAVTGTYTNAFTQESDTSSSFAVNQTTSFVDKISPLTGPALDHGNDMIYVWVNPNVWYTVTAPGAPLQWNGFTYDLSDDSNNMEVIPLRLSELLNPSTIDAYYQGRLKRAWALSNTDGSGPAITNQDLLNIAAQDPFSNSGYTVTLGSDYKTTTDNRFTLANNDGELYYTPGYVNAYNWSYTGTTTAGQGAKTTYSDGFSLEEKFAASFFWEALSYDMKQSTTFEWVDQWNKNTTNMTGESATVQIVGPTGSYSGPEEFNVYVDNIYGTFMVFPVPEE